ncbi:MAG: hypothetical protein Q7S44_02130 [bacterium]|nr:hypothetical protein [bacterium]
MIIGRILRLILYPILVLISWWGLGLILTLIAVQIHVKVLDFGIFNNVFLALPFLIASSVFWFNENPKSALILGALGGVLTWFLFVLLFVFSGRFSPQSDLLATILLTSLSSSIFAWLIVSMRKRMG